MILFPAIDILGGKAVRLYKGDYSQVTVYSERPWEFAEDFVKKGAEAIHLVDLDGAREGSMVNLETIRRIAEVKGLYSEIGGGIRNMDAVERYLDLGISRVILGTAAIKDPVFLDKALEKYGDRIAVGVDMKDGKVAVKGWLEDTGKDGIEFLQELSKKGLYGAIVTDISRDGAMKGTNLDLYRRLSREVPDVRITASGGVSTLDDIRALRAMDVWGAIIGKAYYTGAVDIPEALEAAR